MQMRIPCVPFGQVQCAARTTPGQGSVTNEETDVRFSQQLACIGAMATAMAAWASLAGASSHREAPAITETPKVDGTDLYMFRSYEPGREDWVTFIMNYQPLQAPYGGPNYFTMDPEAIYELHIDNDGDAVEDLTFRFQFTNTLANGTGAVVAVNNVNTPVALRALNEITAPNDPDQAELETYTIKMITGDRRSGTVADVTDADGGGTVFNKPIDNIGQNTIPDYSAYVEDFIHEIVIPGCTPRGKAFAGQRAEGFAVSLGPIFDLVNLVPIEGLIDQSRDNEDVVDEFNITSLALEMPIECLVGAGNGVIGAWMTASLPQAEILDPTPTYEAPSLIGGAFVQQSRLSAPLVNELVIGLSHKDAFNRSEPVNDTEPLIPGGFSVAAFATQPTLPELLEQLFDGVQAPNNFPRDDLAAAFATGIENLNQMSTVTASEMMRLNTGIAPTPQASQSTFGVAGDDLAGFPNGRRPGDDVVDLAIRVVMGRLCHPVPVNGVDTDLELCDPADAPNGLTPFTDGAPISDVDITNGAVEFQNAFPYLNDPIPGSPISARP